MDLPDDVVGVDADGHLDVVVVLLAVGAAVYLTVGVALLVQSTGFSPVQFALFATSALVAWAGVVGAMLDYAVPPLVAALVLFLLGFWQDVLWVFMVPAALGLAVAGVVVGHRA